jgi:hypothetical protein
MKRRLEPFLDLLDARYLPLLFAGAPQAWTVYAWLLSGGTPWGIALLGGIGFEFIYVGAVAWAERGAGWKAARGPAVTALAFSVAVAVAYYGSAQGILAALHAGFPLVAYFYVLMMHVRQGAPVATALVASLQAELAQVHHERAILLQDSGAQERSIGALLAEHDEVCALCAEQSTMIGELHEELAELRAKPAPKVVEEMVLVAQKPISVRRLAELTGKPETTLRRQLAQLEQSNHVPA